MLFAQLALSGCDATLSGHVDLELARDLAAGDGHLSPDASTDAVVADGAADVALDGPHDAKGPDAAPGDASPGDVSPGDASLGDASPPRLPGKYVGGHQMLAMPRYGGNHTLQTANEEITMWEDAGLDVVMLFDLGTVAFRSNMKTYLQAASANQARLKFAPSFIGAQASASSTDITTFMAYLADPQTKNAAFVAPGRGLLLTTWFGMPSILGLGTYVATQYQQPVHVEPSPNYRVFPNQDPNTQTWGSGDVRTPGASDYPSLMATLYGHPEWQGLGGIAAFVIPDKIDDQRLMAEQLATFTASKNITGRASIVAYYRGLPHKGNWMVHEGLGFQRLLASWKGAIDSGINAVEFITLNDFAEATYFNSWKPGDPATIVDHWNKSDIPVLLDHSGFRYASKRYVQWFLTGVEPAITTDEMYYAYRLHPRDAANYRDLTPQEQSALAPWKAAGLTEKHFSAFYRKSSVAGLGFNSNDAMGMAWTNFSDGIHLLVRLQAPADVYINGVKVGSNLAAGEHHLTKSGQRDDGPGPHGYHLYTFGPQDYGYPSFEIRRGGVTVKKHSGELEITAFCMPGAWNVFARRAP